MASVAYMYKSALIFNILLGAVISLISVLICQITSFGGAVQIRIFLISSSIMGLYIYFSPLVFSRRDDTLMMQVPASPLEKWAFYTIYSVVCIPLVVNGLWYGINGLFLLAGKGWGLERMLEISNHYGGSDSLEIFPSQTLLFFLGSIQAMVVIMFVLYLVIRLQRHRALYSILWYIGATVALGIIFGIVGIIWGVHAVMTEGASVEYIQDNVMSLVLKLVYVIYVIYTICIFVLSYLTYRQLARGQVK